MFDDRYDESDNDAYNASMERAIARRDEYEAADVQFELEGESDLERARRLAPITEQKCCLDPGSFTLVQSLDRDMDTGYFTGNFYRCGTCGTSICEEDFAAIVAYEDSKCIPDVDPMPVTGSPIRRKVA
jgi:hypothetical protein